MSGTSSQLPNEVGRSSAAERGHLRYRLARTVIVGSFLAIFLLALTLLGVSSTGGATSDVAEKTFKCCCRCSRAG